MCVPASAQEAAKVSLTRLDCGTIEVNDLNAFSDTRAYTGRKMQLTDSCYLIHHGDDYMLWDTGLPAALKGKALDPKPTMSPTITKTLAEQFEQLGIRPDQVGRVGISHYHYDHTGQAELFPNATLMIGAADWAVLNAHPPVARANPKPLEHWISGGGKVDPVDGDKDVFGDGSVVMLDLPGHTPGSHGLLVKLATLGNVLLSGDVAHFRENLVDDGVPGFNTSRAQSLASMDRFKRLAINLNATMIIQHDPRDIAKLPAFPKAAE